MIPEISTVKSIGFIAAGATTPWIGSNAMLGFVLGVVVLIVLSGVGAWKRQKP